MPISNGTYPSGATVTVTGGTSVTLAEISDVGNSKEVFIDNGGATFLNRTVVKFKVTNPKTSATAPNGYTQFRNDVTIIQPYTPSGGVRTTNTIRLSYSVDPSLPAADKRALLKEFCVILLDSDIDGFFTSGSLA